MELIWTETGAFNGVKVIDDDNGSQHNLKRVVNDLKRDITNYSVQMKRTSKQFSAYYKGASVV